METQKRFITVLTAVVVYVSILTTIAFMSIGDMGSCEPFRWTIVPQVFLFVTVPIFFGWSLNKTYNDYKND